MQGRINARWDPLAIHPDSPGHYVSGLLGWNYLTASLPSDPVGFAQIFYGHYPAVAIGRWPPGYHLAQALWSLIFSPSPTAILWLQAVTLAVAAGLACSLLRRLTGWAGAILATSLFVFAKPSQLVVSGVMAEPLTAALCLGAATAYVSYLERPRPAAALSFGVLAGFALLTKGSAIFLAFLPLSALLCGHFSLLRRWDFWLPAGVALMVAGPWYLGVESIPGLGSGVKFSAQDMLLRNTPRLGDGAVLQEKSQAVLGMFGWGLGSLAVLGAFVGFVARARERRLEPLPAVLGVYLLAALFCHVVLRESGEPRHLLPAAPVGFGFAFFGALWAVRQALGGLSRAAQVAVAAGACLLASGGPRILPAVSLDFDRAAAAITADPSLDEAVMLVSSRAGGEAIFVAEIAALEPKPRRVILRGTKVLADAGWRAQRYELRFDDGAEVAAYLDSIPVGVLVLDDSPGRIRSITHPDLVRKAVDLHPNRWSRVELDSDHLKIYRSTGSDLRRRMPIRIDLNRRIGKVIELPAH